MLRRRRESATNLFSPPHEKFAAPPPRFCLLTKHRCGPSTPHKKRSSALFLHSLRETQAGVEPANGGFANRSVRPLRHCVITCIKFSHSSIIAPTTLEKNKSAWYSMSHLPL